MGGAFEDDQFLGARGFRILFANLGQPRNVARPDVIAGNQEEFSSLYSFRFVASSAS